MIGSAKHSDKLNSIFELILNYSPYILIIFTVLTPDILLLSLPAIRLEQILIFLVLGVEILRFGMKRINVLMKDKMTYLVFGIIILIMLSTFNGMYNGYETSIQDFFGIYKIFIYLGTYFVIKLNVYTEEQVKNVLYIVLFAIFISSLIAITQYFNFFNMNELYIRKIAPTQYVTLVDGYPSPRVIGITSNPNTYALFLGIAGMVTFNFFLRYRKIFFLFGTFYFFIIMNMTKSRTGFIFFVIGIVFLFFIKSIRDILYEKSNYSKKEIYGKILKLILILLLIFAGFIAFILLGPDELTWRLKVGLDILNDKSFMTRVSRWSEYIEMFKIRLFIGVGTTKNFPFGVQVDNEWLILLKKYGLMGTIYFITVFIYPVLKSKCYFTKDLYLAMLIGALFFMITSVFFTIFQLIPLIMLLAALATPLLKLEEMN